MLTDAAARQAKPRERPFKLADEKGLYLEIHPTGARYWRLKYRFAGKEKRLALGVYPEVTLSDARAARDRARAALREGTDPGAAKAAAKRAALVAAATSFEAVAREWHEKNAPRWTPDHAARVLASLEADAFPALGARPVAAIDAAELLAAVRKIEARGAHEVAGRVLQRCSRVFTYAVLTRRAARNPAADLKGALTTVKVTHRPALTAADLPEFLRRLAAYEGHALTRLALRLLLLTFVRTGELRGAAWAEFELDGAAPTWRIPAERMKMRAPHLVPLSRQAVAVLRQVQEITGRGPLAFPNVSNAHKPMSENTLLFGMYRMGYHTRATPHGLRATASTILNEQGWRPDVIERQLAHAERNKVRAAYHRSEYVAERRAMMQAWADYLDSVAVGGG